MIDLKGFMKGFIIGFVSFYIFILATTLLLIALMPQNGWIPTITVGLSGIIGIIATILLLRKVK